MNGLMIVMFMYLGDRYALVAKVCECTKVALITFLNDKKKIDKRRITTIYSEKNKPLKTL